MRMTTIFDLKINVINGFVLQRNAVLAMSVKITGRIMEIHFPVW